MLKILWNIVSAIAVVAGIYQGYVAFKSPKADLELITGTSSFEMPKELDVAFNSIPEEDRKSLATSYALVARNTPMNTIMHGGLHNHGDKLASDIRISFPGARLISVRSEGKEVQLVKGESKVEVSRLLPHSSVYFVVWGQRDNDGKNIETVSGVHSEGSVKMSPVAELPAHWQRIYDKWEFITIAVLVVLLIALVANLFLGQPDANSKKGS